MQPRPAEDNPPTPQDVLKFTDDLIQFYAGGVSKYGGRLFSLKVLGIASSVLVTVLSGISFVSKNYAWMVTIVAGLSTFLTTLLTTTKAHEYYVLSGGQQGKLKAEKLLYLGSGGPYAQETTDQGRLRLLSERVSQIYADGRKSWEQINRPEK
jgi:hypothetical protein